MTPSVTLTEGVVLLNDEGDVPGSDAGAGEQAVSRQKNATFLP